jgi:hypothetical protein
LEPGHVNGLSFIRLSSPWALLFLVALVPLYFVAPQQMLLLFWAFVQITFAVILWLVVVGQVNSDRVSISFGNLESAILLAAMVLAVRMGF